MPIREMNESDLPRILEIQQELAFQNWDEPQFAAELHANYALCVVYEADQGTPQVNGYAIFHLLGPDSELLSIAVSRDCQHKGIGKALLEAGLSRLSPKDKDRCFLEVREGNTTARQFYEKNGFKFFNKRKNYYSDGENACLYSLELESRIN
ncbi:ribosomal protein S18-alanine N-acetyltransferase [uncultured Fibrobacter sp.]|uniref:ribosomal protein S18-alanine N-acetyltransferase n=1 Tax=uncultured Fibrobacter sp. TaxID=261512 RepID=UPI0025E2F5B9|nr:ribosomal protein S18-alanine N-acetyltransferase [uncultured Fibrobacter sp.]